MKEIIKKYNDTSLILRIIIGLAIGVILGVTVPNATGIEILGDMFVGALKAIAPILVFVLVMSSLAQAGKGVSKRFRTVICLYMLSTLLAAVAAVVGSFLFPVSMKLTDAVQNQAAPSGIFEVLRTLFNNMVANPVGALMNANYIGILTWAVILGLALKGRASEHTREALGDISDAVSQAVRWIVNLAPFGIMGLVFTMVSTNGLSIFTDYGKLLLLLVGTMLVMALIIDPFIAAICLHRNPYPLVFRCLKESGLTAFFTRSSAANIPVNMELCEKLGLDKDMYSVSIPLGATINMDGAAITITIMTLATTHTMGIAVDIPTAIILSLLATVSACGASGVAGGSLLLIPMACSLFGISNDIAMQVVGVGFIIGVVQDSFETAINSSGDVLFAATAEFRDWIKEGKEVKF
ncbi:MAG: serine/threonine transporter SstT [Lachnospiraceae bacterium]|nr:serine/threonine transporter SstT [Lachnospiraceae bacterium]